MIKEKPKIIIIISILVLAFIFAMSPLISTIAKADAQANIYNEDGTLNEDFISEEDAEKIEEILENLYPIDDKSILHSYAAKVLEYPLNSGFILDKTIDIESKNVEVYKGYVQHLKGNEDTSTKYCLYELFGDDIHWYRYLGEATYYPTLLDHLWSAIDQDKIDDLSISDIFYKAPDYLSCHVYQNRPEVLTKDDVASGDHDPRVSVLSRGWFSGFSYVMGSLNLTIAKFVVSLVSLLLSHTIMDKFVEVITEIETSAIWTDVIKPVALFFLATVIIFFIISLVGKATKYAKGNGSIRETLTRFFTGIVCLGFMLASVLNPTLFNNAALTVATAIDQLFEASLSATVEGDDVVDVADDDLIIQAVVWKTAIFGPWCRGQFNGLEYNELYTNYAAIGDDPNKSAMPQSNETPDDLSVMDGKDTYFDSSSLTGDVTVPIGGGNNVKNWAAYLYSCGSQYHIDYSLDTSAAANIEDDAPVQFPTANTTYGDKSILADTFRVIDAQMDISPQYFEGGTVVNNYVNAHDLENDFIKQGYAAFFNSLLLLVMIPAIWQKLKNFVLLIITTLKVIFYTILELFKEGNVSEFWRTLKDAFFGYFIGSIKICILVTLYVLFVDKGIFMSIMFILVSIVVYGFSIQDVKRFVSDAKYAFVRYKNRLS